MRRLVMVCLLWLLPAAAVAAEPHAVAVEALKALDAFDEDAWSYTRTTTRGKQETRIERHDASKPKGRRWTLLRVDGRVPTAREQEAFRREKDELAKKRAKRDDRNDVDLDSLRLVSETPQHATYTFKPKANGGVEAKMVANVAGTLVVNKQGGWAERVELRSTAPASPIPGVKISAFRLTMTYQRHAPTREIVPQAIELSMRGRAFALKSLDEDRTTTYSDFALHR